nr:immunoglobulin heavy chain junction region [Macaca mulatta]
CVKGSPNYDSAYYTTPSEYFDFW